MAFLTHRRRGSDRWLEWKVRLFSVAAVLGLAGIYFEERWMTGSAIALLAGGLGLRFLPGSDSMRVELEDDQDDDRGQPAGEPSDGERQAG